MSKQADAAYHYIKDKILEGSYRPSQKLIESDLAETIGVSRNTIKKALLVLQQENLVAVEDNRGAHVKSFSLEEIVNYLEIREVLEGLVAKKAAKNLTESDLAKLEKTLLEMAQYLELNQLNEYSELNRDFHKVIYNACSNTEAVENINIIRTQLIRFHFRTIMVPGRRQESYIEHKKIFYALKARDEREAEEAVKNHVANVRRTIEQNYNYLL